MSRVGAFGAGFGSGPALAEAPPAGPDGGFGTATSGGGVEPHALAAVLASMVDVVRLVSTDYPTWSLPEAAVGQIIGQAQLLRELTHALTAVLTREAHQRGLGSDEGLSRPDWLKTQAPALDGPQAAALCLVGAALADPRWAALAIKVASGQVSIAHAAVLVRLDKDLARIADPEHLAAVIDAMIETIELFTVAELNRLAGHARASMKPPKDLDDEDQRLRAGRAFTKSRTVAGMTEYILRLDPEAAAILDAAIDPLARPRPDLTPDLMPDPNPSPASQSGRASQSDRARTGTGTGAAFGPGAAGAGTSGADASGAAGSEAFGFGGFGAAASGRDPRTPATRRADALLELIGRAVAAPQGQTRTPRTKVVITMTYQALLGKLRGAGIADNDAILSPATVRRMACEASIIPAVLGAASEVLDCGHTERYFTPAQRLALSIRDHGCSYPGCTIPPQWCEAHHVTHWIDGGRTDLLNGALLCGRHHTVVHQRDLTATVTAHRVTWHR